MTTTDYSYSYLFNGPTGLNGVFGIEASPTTQSLINARMSPPPVAPVLPVIKPVVESIIGAGTSALKAGLFGIIVVAGLTINPPEAHAPEPNFGPLGTIQIPPSTLAPVPAVADNTGTIQSPSFIGPTISEKYDKPIYHRLYVKPKVPGDRSNQDGITMWQQLQSGEVWGLPVRQGIGKPTVQAYYGPLLPGDIGFEFTTDVPPDATGHRTMVHWSGPRLGVKVERESDGEDYAKIKVVILKVTQPIEKPPKAGE